ncbi:MarR family winged helix-turn-helix transcriptional regulator [Sporosalibacterium faouarense]|uniref:MarR family winged helix-turn-helix transcriptional regulator n=1 Tax=Sporosalibacterium faouarense TaxID=516123 RepID=UPI001FB00DEE|nr:MarR family transcriptional regulator [Sporosalibacterium faouarense]
MKYSKDELNMEQDKVIKIILDNMKKLFYPEEWLEIDIKLSKSELFAMLIVDRYGEVIMSKISNEINISMSTASGIVDRLVKKKYLKRERSDLDRRIVLIKLTKKGQNTIETLKKSINKYLNIIYESLTDEEIKVLTNVLIKVMDALSKSNEEKNTQNKEKSKVEKIEIE